MLRRGLISLLVVVIALSLTSTAFAADPSSKGSGLSVVTGSAAQDEYEPEETAAGQTTTETEDVFTPPVVLSASEADQADDSDTLPLTGAALLVPTLLGGAMLAFGLVLLYRTRRRDA